MDKDILDKSKTKFLKAYKELTSEDIKRINILYAHIEQLERYIEALHVQDRKIVIADFASRESFGCPAPARIRFFDVECEAVKYLNKTLKDVYIESYSEILEDKKKELKEKYNVAWSSAKVEPPVDFDIYDSPPGALTSTLANNCITIADDGTSSKVSIANIAATIDKDELKKAIKEAFKAIEEEKAKAKNP